MVTCKLLCNLVNLHVIIWTLYIWPWPSFHWTLWRLLKCTCCDFALQVMKVSVSLIRIHNWGLIIGSTQTSDHHHPAKDCCNGIRGTGCGPDIDLQFFALNIINGMQVCCNCGHRTHYESHHWDWRVKVTRVRVTPSHCPSMQFLLLLLLYKDME